MTWLEAIVRTVLYCVFVVIAFQLCAFAASVLLIAMGGSAGILILPFALAGTVGLLWLAWRCELWVRAKIDNKDSTPELSE